MKAFELCALYLALLLIICFSASLLAKWHWLPALLSHFKMQYLYGAVILMPLMIYPLKSWPLALCLLGIPLFCGLTLKITAKPVPNGDAKPALSVTTYNKHFKNQNYASIYKALKDHDIVIITEAEDHEIPALHAAFQDTHPHSLPREMDRPDEIIIFSRLPIKELSAPAIATQNCRTRAIRSDITVQNETLRLYTFHTKVPTGRNNYACHKEELNGAAELIHNDNAENIIALGDWNTTPHAPAFKSFIQKTGLTKAHSNPFTQPTWPAQFMLPIFQIKLDHILYKGKLTLIDHHRGPATGSDHYPITARFGLLSERSE